jgi:hypothetical protein
MSLRVLADQFLVLPWIAQFMIAVGGFVIEAILLGVVVDRLNAWDERRRWARRWRP